MSTETIGIVPPTRSQVLLQVLGALVAGTVLTVLVVLPAEYNIDPTGFGALTGLNRVSAPLEVVVPTEVTAPPEIAKVSDTPFRTDTVKITIPPFTENFGQLEYKVTLNEGDTMVYSWTTSGKELLFEFHGHTLPSAEQPEMQVMNYVKGTATASNGTLTAPITGIHGWYWAQSDFSGSPAPVEVELHLAGYYTLEPGVLDMTRPAE